MAQDPGRLAWELADRIGQAGALFDAVVADVVATTPLTPSEAIALVVLAGGPGGRTQAELGRALGVSRQHAHAVVHKLQRLGLVRSDRRRREAVVRPTGKGERLIEKLRPDAEARLARAIAGLASAERATLHRLAGRLVAALANDLAGASR